MQFCIRHKDRCSALALLVPAVYAEGRTPDDITPPSPFMQFVLDYVLMTDLAMWTIMNFAPGILVQTALATPMAVYERAPPAERERALRLIRDTFPVSQRREGIKNDSAVSISLKRFPLEEIKAPTLLISVQDDLYDTLAGARYTAQHIPHSRLVTYPSGGHVWLGHDEEVTKEILRFLAASGRKSAIR
jgi:pimeloyl-ACP methyl ester carboxylesterase